VSGPARAGAPADARASTLAAPPSEGAPLAEGGAASERASAGARRARPRGKPLLTFARLKWASFTHSLIYLALLVSAFAAGKPEPLTEVLGWTHGLLWISMSAASLTAARRRVVPLRVAVAVAVLGGIGPFFGSLEFIRAQRKRRGEAPPRPR
jgi:hypothetical protein